MPLSDRSTDVELRAHALNFLTGVAESLAMAREAGGGVTSTLRDGSRIQRVISELHGAQRHGLGWSEDALQRDFEVLQEAAEEELRESGPDTTEVAEGLEVLGRIFAHSTRIALQGWRLAEARRKS